MGILEEIGHVLLHSLLDTAKLLPFLFLTYLLMELIEHRAGAKLEAVLRRSGRLGPIFGGVLGAVPQCGFSAVASGFYAGRIITPGTLVAVFLATSDEMIPVAFGAVMEGKADPLFILKLLGIKVVIGVTVGLALDFILFRVLKKEPAGHIEELCEEAHCHCEKGIWRSALHHTLSVGLFLFLITLCLTGLIETVGEDALKGLFLDIPTVGPIVAATVGLIPNCASSVIITQLYLDGVISAGCLLGGLLSGAGVGLLVLFRVNHTRMKENLLILLGVFAAGAVLGILADLCNLGAIL